MNRKTAAACAVALLAIFLPLAGLCAPKETAAGVEDSSSNVPANGSAVSQRKLSWKEEFERLCAQTEVATTLSDQQIRDLIRDSDMLLEKLASLQDPQTRVYVFRLEKCRMFFEFALQLNETG